MCENIVNEVEAAQKEVGSKFETCLSIAYRMCSPGQWILKIVCVRFRLFHFSRKTNANKAKYQKAIYFFFFEFCREFVFLFLNM